MPTFQSSDYIATDAVTLLPDAPLWVYGMLQSAVFTAWQAGIGGRIKSDYRMSSDLIYNTFPFPTLTEKQQNKIGSLTEAMLAARAEFSDVPLNILYDPLSTPPNLTKAHDRLDSETDRAFGLTAGANDSDRLWMLLDRYVDLVNEDDA